MKYNGNRSPSSKHAIPSLKLTARTWKLMVGILVSLWDALFSGAMLVSGRVSCSWMMHQIWPGTLWLKSLSLWRELCHKQYKEFILKKDRKSGLLAAILAICSYPGWGPGIPYPQISSPTTTNNYRATSSNNPRLKGSPFQLPVALQYVAKLHWPMVQTNDRSCGIRSAIPTLEHHSCTLI